jgi:hypothetical protein
MTTTIEFKWPRPRLCELAGGAIRQIGSGRDNQWAPLEHVPDLYLQFAQLDGSEDACLAFARGFGLLTTPAKTGAEERIDDWQREIKRMESLTRMVGMVKTANARRVLLRVTTIDVALLSGESHGSTVEPAVKPILVLQPKTLLDAMKLQLAQAQAGGATLHTCDQCGRLFEVGAGAKRSVAKFCSDKCRQRHHYEQSGR